MAYPNTNFNQVTAITRAKFLPKLVDGIFDSNPLMRILKDEAYDSVDGGEKIVQPLNYAQSSSVGAYSGADTLLIDDNDSITGVQYDWKQYYASVVLSGLDALKNAGTEKVLSLSQSKMQIAEKSLKDVMGTALYNTGSDSKAIAGLRFLVNTSNTVGGISQSSNSWWQGQVDSSTTTFSISALQTLSNLCSIDNDAPSHYLATRSIYNSYYALLQPQQRFQGEKEAAGGFTSLLFNGKPFIVDSHVPASHLFAVNLKYLRLIYHAQRNFIMTDFVKPTNQDVKVAQILFAGALVSTNNRMLGKFSAITA